VKAVSNFDMTEQQAEINDLKANKARQATALSTMERENAALRAQVERIASNMTAIERLVKAQTSSGGGPQTVPTK
jgi:hypothetical protein